MICWGGFEGRFLKYKSKPPVEVVAIFNLCVFPCESGFLHVIYHPCILIIFSCVRDRGQPLQLGHEHDASVLQGCFFYAGRCCDITVKTLPVS